MLRACCDAARSLVHSLLDRGYHPSCLLIGAIMDPERTTRFPNYSLSGPARRLGVIDEKIVERTFSIDGADEVQRTAGIYLIDPSAFVAAAMYQTQHKLSLQIFSRRTDSLTRENLTTTYHAAAFDDQGTPTYNLNWRVLAAAICPMGDIVVKTFGAFDDKFRSVSFVHSSASVLIFREWTDRTKDSLDRDA
jgi:hypothetical protein